MCLILVGFRIRTLEATTAACCSTANYREHSPSSLFLRSMRRELNARSSSVKVSWLPILAGDIQSHYMFVHFYNTFFIIIMKKTYWLVHGESAKYLCKIHFIFNGIASRDWKGRYLDNFSVYIRVTYCLVINFYNYY